MTVAVYFFPSVHFTSTSSPTLTDLPDSEVDVDRHDRGTAHFFPSENSTHACVDDIKN